MQTPVLDGKIFSIYELNSWVKDLIEAGFPSFIWVCGEIQDLRQPKAKKHVYFNLVEKDPFNSDIKAQASAIIFENNKNKIFSQLSKISPGFELKEDIEVKLLCKVSLSVRYGLYSLQVYDIDPSYTLGKIAQNRQKIIQSLTQGGFLEKNKSRSFSLVPLNIALITAFGSAAYHDFLSEIKNSGFSFKIYTYDSHMQGAKVEKDILSALDIIDSLNPEDLDLVVITRGGGSTADLSCFDNEIIAKRVANCKMPVFTALGHEINTTILDLVAHSSFKTPTKVAQFLVERIGSFSQNLDTIHEDILFLTKKILDDNNHRLEMNSALVSNSVLDFFSYHKQLLAGFSGILEERYTAIISNQRKTLNNFSKDISLLVKSFVRSKTDQLNHFSQSLDLVDPKKVLKRGFSITLFSGKAVFSSKSLKKDDELKTILYNGCINSKVI